MSAGTLMSPLTSPLMRRLAALLLSLSSLLPAVAAQAQPVSLRDDRGVTVQLPQPPKRIVSLLPSLTETVCALGECARLVGTDRYSNWPESVNRLPKVGGLEDAQVERIVALAPDVVLASQSARVLDRLEGLGLKVIAIEARDHASVRRTTQALAALLGRSEQGAQLLAQIEQQMQRAAVMTPASLRGRKVYFEVDAAPYAAGASSFVGETLARLGLGNIVPAEMGPFPKLNPEYVVRAQPDLIMAVQRNVAAMPGRPGWNTLRALRQQQTCAFDATHYDILVRPGPRLGEAALVMADCLQRLAASAPPAGSRP
jgi:iron complex transport system substrate-binding protein